MSICVECRQDGGHAHEAHLALVAQRQRLRQRTLGGVLGASQARMELDEVEVVRPQRAEAVLHADANVLRGLAMNLPISSSLRP